MSALAVVFARDGTTVAPSRVLGLSRALRAFGPDAVESCSGPVGLVRRTAQPITDEDAFDRQPIELEDGRLVLFCGFLPHRGELAQALGLSGRRAERLSDGALFAQAWQRWGEEAALQAEGQFAAVVWDPARRTLTAACSPLDAPPLCYSLTRRRAVVSTVPRGVFAWGDLPRRLDDERLASRLIGRHGSWRRTYYEGVQCLGPGEMLKVGPERSAVVRYYDLDEQAAPVEASEDYLAATDQLLRRAVSGALRSRRTPAVLLSGGMDSPTVAVTALAALAEAAPESRMVSFTARPASGWEYPLGPNVVGDESPLVRKLAEKHPRLDARFFDVAGVPVDHLLDRVVELAEGPPRNVENLPWVHEGLRLARETGTRVVLTGGSGNATLSYDGLARFPSMLRAGRFGALLHESWLWRGRWSRRLPLMAAVAPYLHPGIVRMGMKLARVPGQLGRPGASPIQPDFAKDTRVYERAREAHWGYWSRPAKSSRAQRIRMLTMPMRQGDGRFVFHALRAVHGVAVRDPLGDRRLAEWCVALPGEAYWSRGEKRLLIRRLMHDRFPPEMRTGVSAVQAADRHMRFTRAMPRLREEMHEWRRDPEVAGRIDVDRLLRAVETWPARMPAAPNAHPDSGIVRWELCRTLAVGRFIRWVQRGY